MSGEREGQIRGVYNLPDSVRYWLWSWNKPVDKAYYGNDPENSLFMHKKDGEEWLYALLHDCPINRTETPPVALDIGCGAGKVSQILLQHGYEVIGLDLNPYFIEWCNAKFHEKPNIASEFVLGDCSQIDRLFEPNKFELVTAHMLMNVLSDDQFHQTLSAVARVLTKSGRFIYMIPNPEWKQINHIALYKNNDQVLTDVTPWGSRTVYHHRSVEYQLDTLSKAGFTVDSISNPWSCKSLVHSQKGNTLYDRMLVSAHIA